MEFWTVSSYIVLVVYTIILIYICIFCLIQFQLLYYYRKTFGKRLPLPKMDKEPVVTIQLPIYNEIYVAERLIEAVCDLDYPKDKMEIQVLDDSTDETSELTRKKVDEYKTKGFDIHWVHREDRHGFKAGALQNGLKTAKGEFIAIFDADFVPKKDFLKETLPFFGDSKVGVVQTRWEHINQDYSLITRIQALQLNVHFTVEQKGRDNGNYFLQFNGTAGLWRKDTIRDAGGWKADTLTEDLDLSYRAQLKGWKIKYLEHLGSPAELPIEMNSFKSQQYRWMKGGAETAKKLLPVIWKSPIGFSKKVHATMNLLGSTIFIFVFALGILSVPALLAIRYLMINSSYWSIFVISSIALVAIYYVANVLNPFIHFGKNRWSRILKFVFIFPVFLSFSMGLSLHNSIAVLQGYLGKKTPFIRTPKFNIGPKNEGFKYANPYLNIRWDWKILLEGLLAIYFFIGICASFLDSNFSMIVFHLLLFFGYSSIFYFSIKDLKL